MRTFLIPFLAACGLAGVAHAAEAPGTPATKPYPLTTCIISGDALGTMGDAIVIVQDGQEVKFCCKGCIKTFTKDPATYLKKIEEAAAAKAPAKAPAKADAAPVDAADKTMPGR